MREAVGPDEPIRVGPHAASSVDRCVVMSCAVGEGNELSHVTAAVAKIGVNYVQTTALLAGFDLDWGRLRHAFSLMGVAAYNAVKLGYFEARLRTQPPLAFTVTSADSASVDATSAKPAAAN